MKLRIIAPLAMLIALTLAWWIGYSASRGPLIESQQSTKSSKVKAPSLPAPKIMASTTPSKAPEPVQAAGNPLLERLLTEGSAKISLAQLQSYIAQNKRDAESLLTASRLTDDLTLLREAAKRFPNDARVQLDLALRSDNPAERQQAIAALVNADPANAMGNYLAAGEAFNAGNADEAVRQLSDAAARSSLDDYLMLNVQSAEDAYIAAGYDPVAAKAAAMFGASVSHATKLRELGAKMAELSKSYAARGDTESAQALAEMGLALGQRVQTSLGSNLLISDLIGMSIEKRFLDALNPSASIGGQGLTVQQRLEQIAEHKRLVGQLSRTVDPTSSRWSPQLLSQYLERTKLFGELAAMQWLQSKQ